MPYTINSLITDACVEINASSTGQPVEGAVGQMALSRLNMILDHLNAHGVKLYADKFDEFVIPITGNPITIGPSGADWTYPIARPQEIPQASIILTSTPTPRPYVPLTRLTTQEWQSLAVPKLASSLPNYYYYNPTWPNGEFHFWTAASEAYSIQIVTRQLLSQVAMNDAFVQPPSYWYALMMLLARKLSSPLRKEWKPTQDRELTEACMAAFGNNAPDLDFSTLDVGVPVSGSGSGRMQDFNFYTGNLTR